jgi:hypothetical protein
MDYRISVEEIASKFEIEEMARSIIQEAMERQEMEESPIPTLTIRFHCHNSLGKIEEQTELPF